MAEQLVMRGTLEGHSGWVTSLATSLEKSVVKWISRQEAQTDSYVAQTCSSLAVVTRLSSSGTLPATIRTTATLSEVYTATLTLSLTVYV